MRLVAVLMIVVGLGQAEPTTWVGKTILVKRPGVKLAAEPGSEKILGELTGIDYRVRDERDGWIQVATNEGPRGWFAKSEAVSLETAVDYFTERIEQKPSADAYACRAVAHREKHELDAALRDLGAAIRLEPSSAAWHTIRALLYAEKGDFDDALRDFDASLKLVPKNGPAHLGRANVLYAKQDYAHAIEEYDAALALDSKFVMPIFYRANALYQKRDFDQAIRDYEEVLKREPRFEVAYHNRGNAFFAKREFAKAIADYTETIRLLPTYAPAYNHRGASEYYLKDYAAALKDYEKAVALDPELASAWYGMAWLYAVCPDAKIRSGAQALAAARTGEALAKTRTPKLSEIWAAVFAEQGDFDRAVRMQQEAVSDPAYVRLYGDVVGARLELYRSKRPYRDD